MMLKALELDKSGELQKWLALESFDSPEKVEAVKGIYKSLNVDELAFQLMEEFYQKGLSCLAQINASEDAKNKIIEFAQTLMKRSS